MSLGVVPAGARTGAGGTVQEGWGLVRGGVGGGSGRELVAASEFGPLDLLAERAHDTYQRGDHAGAVAAALRALPVALGTGDRTTARYLRYTAAVALQESGRHADAVAQVHALLADVDRGSEPCWRAKGLALLAEASLALGEQNRAMDALAEGSWLLGAVRGSGYNCASATQAVALALRSAFLHEQADDLMMSMTLCDQPANQLAVVQEAALLRAHWAAVLELLGRSGETAVHHRVCIQRALRMRRLADQCDHEQMRVRADIYEAWAWLRLGEPGVAEMVLRPVLTPGLLDGRTVEGVLAHLVAGDLALRGHDLAAARSHLEVARETAMATGQDIWAATATAALAGVDEAEFGAHPGVARWQWLARDALQRLWRDTEERFAALSARIRVRELLAQTVAMGEAARRDPLTGLGNRQRLLDLLDGPGEPVAVLFVDVDRFKSVNDTFSHEVGDEVLRQVATLLARQCRAGDVVVRYGGDEFVVVVSDDPRAAAAVADRVHAAVRDHPWGRAAPGLAVSVSVGVATAPDLAAALAAADASLYDAKRQGRNRVVRRARGA